jgi:hypothetical protein
MNGPDGKRFPWGKITQIHSIGPYDIVEFVWKDLAGPDRGKTHFTVYVYKKDTSIGADELDKALALAISYRHEGVRCTSAAHYFMKMIRS